MPVSLVVMTAAGFAALVTVLITRPVLSRLPEPLDAADKTPYRELPTRRFLVGCAATSAAMGGCAAWALPPELLPPWLVLAILGVLLAGVDLLSTWLPRRLNHAAWLLMGAALLLSWWAGAEAHLVVWAGAGALGAAAIYGLVWALSRGGLGFGDVRFAPLIGAAAGGVSVTVLVWSLILGSLLGAAHGLIRLAWGRAGPFPYAPAMLAGAYLALILVTLTTT